MNERYKTALVTGGNSGIGYATAKCLKEKGYRVCISGRDEQLVAAAAEELGVSFAIADMASLEDLETLAERFSDGLDALVNNAAIARFMPLTEISTKDHELFYNTNVRGPLVLINALLPALEKHRGSITNVSSAIVNNGLPNAALYAATKGAVEAFTRSLALELAPKNIRINVVSPGAIETAILYKLGRTPEQRIAAKKRQEALIPLSRYGAPEEVAQVIVSQLEATYVTGSIWSVDGGVDAY